jgi:hypothetical protein
VTSSEVRQIHRDAGLCYACDAQNKLMKVRTSGIEMKNVEDGLVERGKFLYCERVAAA